jgi:hypothetical protein
LKKFDLNIEKVLEDWGVHSALREVIANALDEQALTNTKDVEIFRAQQGIWHVRDYGRGLRYEHLTQNENQEKQAQPELVIGKFGVGLKDALATFDRQKINTLIRSRYGDITICKSSKHGFEDITTLHAVINEASNPHMLGTEFVIEGIKDADMDLARDFFLKFSGERVIETTHYGQVLSKGQHSIARIYITGLRVAEEQNFLCSYNITAVNTAIKKALNRERTNVGRSAYTERVKAILLDCKQPDVAQTLVDDLKNYEHGTLHDELTWIDVQVHACKLLNANADVIFLTPAELIDAKDLVNHAIKDGHQVVAIPESVKHKITDRIDHQGNPIRDLGGYKKERDESFTFQFINEADLTAKERAVFNKTEAILTLVGGRPQIIKEILISATMRTETFNNQEALGIWDPSTQRIIIKRNQLDDFGSYAGTLLHEIAHATSDATDITEEFEIALTELLGRIAKNTLP